MVDDVRSVLNDASIGFIHKYISPTYRFDQLPEMSFKLLFELSQVDKMQVILKTEKHRDVQEK